MTEPMELATIAKRVHDAHWIPRRVDAVIGVIDVTLRGGDEKTFARDFGCLQKYLAEAGEVSLRLLRPADGVVIGKIITHLTQLGLIGEMETEGLVKAFTVYLRGSV